ncbi:Pls/PosA family non-ribosomal peptide synthetase [Flavobacterium sp. 7A]|uniref:Pls/PosA family non-ribosomal peptide synthetase n=1 Tax=Flavobacterium sp. 7A TaxID=2940571 RepID=UPI00222614CC|nr:Pls/PosA family non-ribosomal peptide synthetase [Flavobacterium sp. 7A]MCW2118731.1 non-ribosomal peptide synthetase-like protein [Flavobacterium sp. 7A]
MKKSILCGIINPQLEKEETLVSIFSSTVASRGDKMALLFEDESVTYQELDNWSNAVANQLIEQGFTKGKTIGIWHKRSLELHVAILAIVKAGCTYVPLDYDMPLDRVETVFDEGKVSAYFSDRELVSTVKRLEVIPNPNQTIALIPISYSSTTDAYILYTSGSTGKPKGIPIMQKQICHLVRSENEVIKIVDADIVYQGFSVSFDMWCEETWISYLAGATLVVANTTTSKAVDELSEFLRANNVTILHAVPSLLAVIDDNIPSLRLVNAGGEACSANVLKQWSQKGIQFFNSYGPTETTVTSSMIALLPEDEITIGHPLPNYNYAVIDENLNIVPVGVEGELIITGPGVGKGYVNLPELTAQKFILKPIAESDLPGEIIYKTGDAVVINEQGKVIFKGRIDDQVKIRGYRIELGEIENQLSSLFAVKNAAVAVKKDTYDQDELVAYVQISDSATYNPEDLRQALLKKLPVYMVPNVFVPMQFFTRLPSGKINRKELPIPVAFLKKKQQIQIEIKQEDSIETKIMTILSNVFTGKEITKESDFFLDLGGHSLIAANFVSKLRREGSITRVSIKDIYLNRPLSKFIEAVQENNSNVQVIDNNIFNEVKPLRYYLCFIAQILSLPLIFTFFSAQLYIPYLGYYYTQVEHENHFISFAISIILFCFISPLMIVISIFSKKILIGKFKAGEYPLWGQYYFRYWLNNSISKLVNVNFFNGTPLYNRYLRSMGMKVGKNVHFSMFDYGAADLIEIGDCTSISSSVVLNNVVVENGLLKISSIKIGEHCYVGTSAVIDGNSVMANQSELTDLSYLSKDHITIEGGIYSGSPAILLKQKSKDEYSHAKIFSKNKILIFTFIYTALLLIFPFAVLIPFFPGLIALYELDQLAGDYQFYYLVLTPLIAVVYILIFIFQTAFFSRVLLNKVKPGKYSVLSRIYLKKWLADQFCDLSLFILHPVYATVFVSSYYRALGAKVGNRSEISTASNITPPLLTIGDESFIADAVNLGESDVRDNYLILEETKIGNKTFVGNSALVPQGTILGDNMLIGVLSIPPDSNELLSNPAKDWFGSPPVAMPLRQKSKDFDDTLTFNPSKATFIKRTLIEFIRIITPITFVLCSSWLFITYIHDVIISDSWYMFVFYLPLYFLGFIAIPSFIFVLVLKWLLVGKYKSKQMPMWSREVWLSEAITSTYEALAVPYLLTYLEGTPLLPFCLRFLGVKIGKRACLYTTDFTEFDVINIGNDVTMNKDCGPQTHLFEDRIMKIGTISIDSQSSIGVRTIILYDSIIGKNVNLGPLSLVMKGENLSDNTSFQGCPIKS